MTLINQGTKIRIQHDHNNPLSFLKEFLLKKEALLIPQERKR